MASYKSSDSILDSVSVSVFWYIMTFIFGAGLIYILLWSIQPENNNLASAIISIIFLFMFIISLILSKFEILRNGTLAGNSLALWLGVVFWATLRFVLSTVSTSNQKFFSLTADTAFFSTSIQSLPLVLQFIFNVIVAPIAEELLWIVAIPYVVISVSNYLAKNPKYKILSNKIVQLLIMIAIGAPTFALFHIGNVALTGFLIFVGVFRAILLTSVYLPSGQRTWAFSILPAFAIGAHITNNLIEFGVTNGFQLLNSSFFYTGLLGYIFIFGTLALAVFSIYNKLTRGTWSVGGNF